MMTVFEFIQNLLLRRKHTRREQAYVCLTEQEIRLNMKSGRCNGVPRNFVRGRVGSTNSVQDRGHRQRGSGGGSSLVRDSGGSCNLVQEISFHIVRFS